MKAKNIFYLILLCLTSTVLLCSCGKGGNAGALTWKLKGGTLTISGQGKMLDYDNCNNGSAIGESGFTNIRMCNAAPWRELSAEITSVIIEEGVQNIGNNAFATLNNLQFVVIPSSITTIGEGAFIDCISLKNITIPNNVGFIGSSAFRNCTNLTDIVFINRNVFVDCTSLTNVVFGEGDTKIEGSAFADTPFGEQFYKQIEQWQQVDIQKKMEQRGLEEEKLQIIVDAIKSAKKLEYRYRIIKASKN